MKIGTTELVKFRHLKRLLSLPQYAAIGLLESLWMFASKNAPIGDIGRHTNEDIACMIEWNGDADELIAVLVKCGWLDEHQTHRLIIHDWSEHAPNWLKGNLAKHGKQFAVQSTVQTAVQPTKQVAKQATKQPAQPDPHATTTSSQSTSSQAKPNQTTPAVSDLDFKNDEVFWDFDPVGWIELDWMAARQAFLARWKKLPSSESTGGVRTSRLNELAADLRGPFADRWSNREWRNLCREAFAKIATDGGLRNKSRLTLKRWLTEESLADSVVSGTYDFEPGRTEAAVANEKPTARYTAAQIEYLRSRREVAENGGN